MAATSLQPNPPIPTEQVVIDVDSVAYGYPVDPQPLPSTAATEDLTESEECQVILLGLVLSGLLLYAVIGLVFLLNSRKKLPRFQLDSVSFDANTTTAAWGIGFSIDKPVGDLQVLVRFMEREYKVESVGPTAKVESAGNATISVSALLPRDFDYSGSGIRLEQVTFRCSNYKDYLLEAACKDVALGFSSNETSTRGVMQGGSRLCPRVNHTHI